MQRSQIIGNYKLTAKLGSGAFAKVFRAECLSSHREVALKIGKTDMVTTHEVNVMESLQGFEGFPVLYEAKTYKALRFIAMELLGCSAAERFRASGKHITAASTVEIVTQGIDRLRSLHKVGYIHRDIKPQHLLYGNESQKLYLMDFGLAAQPSYTSTLLNGARSVKMVGNARFIGINAHLTPDHSQADDIESMVYVALYFMCGSLPWDPLFEEAGDQWMTIRDAKNGFLNKGCPGFPHCIQEALVYLRSLRHSAKPDYEFVKSKIEELQITEQVPVIPTLKGPMLKSPKRKARSKPSPNKSNVKTHSPTIPTLSRKNLLSPIVPLAVQLEDLNDLIEFHLDSNEDETSMERLTTRKIEMPVMGRNLRQKVSEQIDNDRCYIC